MSDSPAQVGLHLCKKLFSAGYTAYFAGGWVRDLLLGSSSDEIDIATSAPPEVIQKLFPKTIPVGVAFGVVIVVMGGIHFEVSTFRKDHSYLDGRHPDGVDFSSPEKDAERRDFTINGMFYDPLTDMIYDYVGGRKDLADGIIRAIGNPQLRFSEDRLRLLRAVRFAARFKFQIEEETEKAILTEAGHLFPSVSMERVWQEFNKMAILPHFPGALLHLHELGLLETIFPQMQKFSREKFKKQVAPLSYFPLITPTIIYLLELFPNASLEERVQLCHYLKTPRSDHKLVEFFTHSEHLFKKKSVEAYDWAHFYAHSHSSLFLEVQAARILAPDRLVFIEEHAARIKKLSPHVERIREGHPIVGSRHLMELGIKPGREMGDLLRRAERIAINHDLDTPEDVLKELQNM